MRAMTTPKKPRASRAKKRPAVEGIEPLAAPSMPPRKGGQPSLYSPAYCEEIIELGRLGWSTVQCASHFNVTRQTLYEWRHRYPDFDKAMILAAEHAQAYWENVGATGALTKKVDATIWGRIMAARFKEDWTDRKQVDHSGQIDTGRSNIVSDILSLVAKKNVKDLV